MTFTSPRRIPRQSPVSRVRAWLRHRRDQRIIDGLSEAQLKDIGFRRLPDGALSPREW